MIRYNREVKADGEVDSVVPGWVVTYPAHCNGHLGDLGFVASSGYGGSGFVHFTDDGMPYGIPLTVAARDRLVAMRRDHKARSFNTEPAEPFGLDDCSWWDTVGTFDCWGRVGVVTDRSGEYVECEGHFNGKRS